MEEIIQYAFFWRTEENVGMINLVLASGGGGQVIVDSPEEASLLLDVLRNEKPLFYDRRNALIATGLEPVGEGE